MEDEEEEEEGRKKKMGEKVKSRERIKRVGKEKAKQSPDINNHIFYCHFFSYFAKLLAILD